MTGEDDLFGGEVPANRSASSGTSPEGDSENPVPQLFSAEPDFDDSKGPEAFRTIGEVSGALGIKPHVLRYWEEQFPMLSPVKRSGSRRYYRPADVSLLQKIDRLLNREGYTIKGAVRAIKADAAQSVAQPTGGILRVKPAARANAQLVARLHKIRAALADAIG